MTADEVRAMYEEPPGTKVPRFPLFTRECVGVLLGEIDRLKAREPESATPTPQHAAGVRVYIAGPYSKGDTALNVRGAVEAADEIMAAGFTPFVPHLTHLWHLVSPKPRTDWLTYDLEWLQCCRYLVRLPGESLGADGEVRRAAELGIPVYHGVEAFLEERREGRLP